MNNFPLAFVKAAASAALISSWGNSYGEKQTKRTTPKRKRPKSIRNKQKTSKNSKRANRRK